jgi:histone-lysine N-methyltransferase SETD2
MGGPPAAAASTSSAPPGSRRCSSRLINPPRRDDHDLPPCALSSDHASTSSQPRRRSARLIGLQRRGDQDQPPRALCSEAASTSSQPRRRSARPIGLPRRDDQLPPPPRASTPPLAVEGDATPASAAPTLRRSARVHLRVRGLPSAASPSTPRRRRRRSPTAPRPKSIEAKAEEWGKEKVALGVPQEECVLPFLQKGAPRKVRTWLKEFLCFVSPLFVVLVRRNRPSNLDSIRLLAALMLSFGHGILDFFAFRFGAVEGNQSTSIAKYASPISHSNVGTRLYSQHGFILC